MVPANIARKAKRMAERTQEPIYIGVEDGEWFVANDFDMETYWLGAPVQVVVNPDGEMEYAY